MENATLIMLGLIVAFAIVASAVRFRQRLQERKDVAALGAKKIPADSESSK